MFCSRSIFRWKSQSDVCPVAALYGETSVRNKRSFDLRMCFRRRDSVVIHRQHFMAAQLSCVCSTDESSYRPRFPITLGNYYRRNYTPRMISEDHHRLSAWMERCRGQPSIARINCSTIGQHTVCRQRCLLQASRIHNRPIRIGVPRVIYGSMMAFLDA